MYTDPHTLQGLVAAHHRDLQDQAQASRARQRARSNRQRHPSVWTTLWQTLRTLDHRAQSQRVKVPVPVGTR